MNTTTQSVILNGAPQRSEEPACAGRSHTVNKGMGSLSASRRIGMTTVFLFLILSSAFLLPNSVRAADPPPPPTPDACSKPDQSTAERLQCRSARLFGQSTTTTNTEGTAPLANRVGGLIQTILSLVGIVFLVFTVYSGIQWMMAGGNEEVIKQARARVTQATIGLLIVIGSWFITNFILSSVLKEPRGQGGYTVPGTGGRVRGFAQ